MKPSKYDWVWVAAIGISPFFSPAALLFVLAVYLIVRGGK